MSAEIAKAGRKNKKKKKNGIDAIWYGAYAIDAIPYGAYAIDAIWYGVYAQAPYRMAPMGGILVKKKFCCIFSQKSDESCIEL